MPLLSGVFACVGLVVLCTYDLFCVAAESIYAKLCHISVVCSLFRFGATG